MTTRITTTKVALLDSTIEKLKEKTGCVNVKDAIANALDGYLIEVQEKAKKDVKK